MLARFALLFFFAMRLTQSFIIVMLEVAVEEETMGELPPLGRVKPIRVPEGKETEYGEDRQGNPIHLQYGQDDDIPGTVLPSALPATVSPDGRTSTGGGSPGFNVSDLNIPQNIVTYDEMGHQVITQVSRADLIAGGTGPVERHDPRHQVTPTEIDSRGRKAEDIFRNVTGAAKSSPPPQLGPRNTWGYIPLIEEGGSQMAKQGAKKRKKKQGKTSRRVRKSAPTPPPTPPPTPVPMPEPIAVQLSGSFGTITQHFSGIIRQGVSLVLVTDHRQIPQAYSPPPATGEEPLEMTVQWGDQEVTCFWAGLSFTMPDGSVTFTVLLAEETGQDKAVEVESAL